MQNSIQPLSLILNLNDRLFTNALQGITDDMASERPSAHNNPVLWIAGHTLWARYMMLIFLGKPVDNPYQHLFENFKAYDVSLTYPSLSEVKSEWEKVTSLLKEAMQTVTAEHLAADSPVPNPIGDLTNAGTFTFLAQHESYDIGQIGYLKKYYTKEAMKY
jgi:hypothetical protein